MQEGKSPSRPKHTDPRYRYFMSQRTSNRSAKRKILEAKIEHEEIILENAREMVAGGELIKKPQRYKTLFYGLKLNHPRNVALVHPLMFTMRRVIYALVIVFLADTPLIGVWLVMLSTMIMLSFAVTEHPWKDAVINTQHTFNEVVTYFVCVYLLLFNGFIPAETRLTLGYSLIALITVFLVYNGVIMTRKIYRLMKLLMIKYIIHKRQRALKLEALKVNKKIK